MGKEQKRLFQLSGTLHLFAVSGLHVGFLYIILSFLMKCLSLKIIMREVCISIILLLYLNLVEYPPSAMRATLMILSWQVSKLLFKKSRVSSTLALSAILILVLNPSELFSVGFQLSYTVVMSISIICDNITNRTSKNIIITYLSKSIKISYAAFIGSLLIIYDYFSIIVPGSIIINIFIIPITFIGINLIFLHFIFFFIFDSTILLIFIECIYFTIEFFLEYVTIENIVYFEFENNKKLFELVHFIYPFSFVLYKSYFKNNILNFVLFCTLPILIILIIQQT
jgi:competence protein ComEC